MRSERITAPNRFSAFVRFGLVVEPNRITRSFRIEPNRTILYQTEANRTRAGRTAPDKTEQKRVNLDDKDVRNFFYDLVPPDLVRCGLVWYGSASSGTVRSGLVKYDSIRNSVRFARITRFIRCASAVRCDDAF